MKLKPLASNMTELTLNDGTTILFSYQTPVAAHRPGEGFMVTDQHYSQTTTRHINKWLGGAPAVKVSQSVIERLSGTESGPFRRNPPRGPGKFSDSIEELLYALDHDQTVGSSDELGWYGLVSGLTRTEAQDIARDLDLEWDDDDADQYDWPLNAIIREGNDGDIDVATFKENREAIREWRYLEEEYERYYGESEE